MNLDAAVNCSKDCRWMVSGGNTTLAYYPPIYDKNGKNINPDMNSTFSQVKCLTCNREWSTITQAGKTTYTEIL